MGSFANRPARALIIHSEEIAVFETEIATVDRFRIKGQVMSGFDLGACVVILTVAHRTISNGMEGVASEVEPREGIIAGPNQAELIEIIAERVGVE
jgi:hypothetical protein